MAKKKKLAKKKIVRKKVVKKKIVKKKVVKHQKKHSRNASKGNKKSKVKRLIAFFKKMRK